MKQENVPHSTVFDFSQLKEQELDGIGLTIGFHSQYNIKATYNGRIVGYIIVEERNPNFYTSRVLDEKLRDRAVLLNRMRWLCIRKIYLQDIYIDSGNLENMFDKFVLNLHNAYNLWCDTYYVGKYIEQIGGFTDLPKEICPNQRIRIYSVYQQKNE